MKAKHKHTYTHIDANGIRWRFVGSRPVSELADQVMANTGMEFPPDGRELVVIEVTVRKPKRSYEKN